MYANHQHSTENSSSQKAGRSSCTGNLLPFFQPKLSVNTPGDAHEQEADQVADQVMRMRQGDAPIVQRMPITPVSSVQRACANCAHEKEKEGVQRKETGGGDAGGKSAPSIVSDVLSSGGGQPMDGGTKQFMETRFGQDFSQVRIHTDHKASESAHAIQARAYTSGRDVVFGQGEYQPDSESGRRLLAHELVHVGQQGGGEASFKVQRRARRRRTRVASEIRQPTLSLYQQETDAASFFSGLATRKAREINALALNHSDVECPETVQTGASPFRSGADIIQLIGQAYRCTGSPVSQIHIFSHGYIGGYGVAGRSFHSDEHSLDPTTRIPRGWVTQSDRTMLNSTAREMGARYVSDLPPEAVSENAVFVFHGCRIAEGETSFAEQLLRHLMATRAQVRVFAHPHSGEAGRRRDWRRFDSENPDGTSVRTNPFHR